MRSSDERAFVIRSGEDDVARLVANPQGLDDMRLCRTYVDDTDAVRQVVHNPDTSGRVLSDRNGIEPDRD